MKRFKNFHHIFIYGFGYFYSKQRLQQRRMAELVISSSNKHTTQSDVIQCSNLATITANFPLQINQKRLNKNIGVNKIPLVALQKLLVIAQATSKLEQPITPCSSAAERLQHRPLSPRHANVRI
jgi:hypothetical protein